MEIRILLDISEKFEKAVRRLAYSILAGGAAFAKGETATNQDVPAEETPESARTVVEKEGEATKAPKKRAKARKAAEPAEEITTPAAMADGGKDADGKAENVAEAETAAPEQATAQKLYGVYSVAVAVAETEPEDKPEAAQENEDELGKGAVGEVISELTGKLINRMNEEARDKATINRNLRAKCEELQLKFPTVPALIQAIGYGNAYKACIGEG